MKYIISESQLKKFKKENLNRGKFGNAIDMLVSSYFNTIEICDTAVFQSDIDENLYVLMVLVNGYEPYNLKNEIKYIVEKRRNRS